MNSQKNRSAVIAAARHLRDGWRQHGSPLASDVWRLNEALNMLDRPQRVTEFQAGIRRRGIKLCDIGDCWLRADHVAGKHAFSDRPNRCTYVEDGLRCACYGDETYHTDHILDDR